MPKIFVICVNYDSKESLLDLFSSLRNLEITNLTISGLILDITGEIAFDTLPHGFSLFRIPENRGYAYAVNIGLKTAKVRGADYVWILNPDVVLESTSLVPLVEISKANTNAVIGSSVYSLVHVGADRAVWGMGGYVSDSGEVSMGEGIPEKLLGTGENSFFECDYVPGCSMFLPTALLAATGYLPEEYFLYFEETEWCLRAKERGVKMLISVSSEIVHKVYPGKLEEAFRVYFYNRSRRMFLWRNRGLFKSGSNVLTKSVIEFPSLTWALLNAPPESKKKFLAHFYSLVDFFIVSYFFSSLLGIARLSRNRMIVFLSSPPPHSK